MVTLFRNGFRIFGDVTRRHQNGFRRGREDVVIGDFMVEIAADIDGKKLRRAVHCIMPLCVELGFIVQKVVVVLKDHEDPRFKERLDQIFVVQSSAVTDVIQ